MNKAQERLAERLFDEGAIKFGSFKLKLHEKNPDAPLSPIFINLRTEDNPGKKGPLSSDLVSNIGRSLYSLTIGRHTDYKGVAGIPYAGDPFAQVMYHANRLFGGKAKLIKLTKEESTDGKRQITGIAEDSEKITPGDRVLLIDDLITKADSKFESIEILEDAGAKIEGVFVVVDREQGGADEMKKAGYELISIFKISELLIFYCDKGKITKQKHDEVMDYIYANK